MAPAVRPPVAVQTHPSQSYDRRALEVCRFLADLLEIQCSSALQPIQWMLAHLLVRRCTFYGLCESIRSEMCRSLLLLRKTKTVDHLPAQRLQLSDRPAKGRRPCLAEDVGPRLPPMSVASPRGTACGLLEPEVTARRDHENDLAT